MFTIVDIRRHLITFVNVKKPLLVLALLLSQGALKGCLGTAMTRCQGQPIGGIPYSGTAFSAVATAECVTANDAAAIGALVSIPSLPVDLAVDTILLVPDLIGWCLGATKTWGMP